MRSTLVLSEPSQTPNAQRTIDKTQTYLCSTLHKVRCVYINGWKIIILSTQLFQIKYAWFATFWKVAKLHMIFYILKIEVDLIYLVWTGKVVSEWGEFCLHSLHVSDHSEQFVALTNHCKNLTRNNLWTFSWNGGREIWKKWLSQR